MQTTRPILISIAIVVLAIPVTSTYAQERTNHAADEAAIKQLAFDWQEAWNERDADALTALLAEDVDFITVLGPNGWLQGQERFKEVHARMFTTLFTESEWTTKDVHVKFIRPDVAFARVLWVTTGDKVRHIKHGEPRQGIFTWVTEKRDGRWRIIASQNTEVMSVLPGQ
jgi:uncharacterized protein (TIGR02246 family)